MHGLLLLWWLAVDDAVPQVSEILQSETPFKSKRWEAVQIRAGFYLLVEQDETQERPGHRPLVPAVLEDDDVQHRGQHLHHSDTVTKETAHLKTNISATFDL